MTVAIVGTHLDKVLRHFAKYLIHQDLDCVMIDQLELKKTVYIDSDQVKIKHHTFKWTDFSAVYSRVHGFFEDMPLSVYSDLGFLHFFLDTAPIKIINRPRSSLSNDAKGYQLDCLQLNHLQKPSSMMVANGFHTNDDSWIYKSASSVRSIVQKVQKKGEYVVEPVLFQKCITGDNVRVHVIENDVHAVRIQSRKIDYRYCDARSMKIIDLPDDIKQECIDVAQQLSLIFCGIDLIQNHLGWFILEVNPQPGYAFFEDESYSISKSLFKALQV